MRLRTLLALSVCPFNESCLDLYFFEMSSDHGDIVIMELCYANLKLINYKELDNLLEVDNMSKAC